jgi:outer membrane protein OmpA-like peptidoglycan-associated protein/uncharacterized surface protein with fasciclin (FAS1) repeats
MSRLRPRAPRYRRRILTIGALAAVALFSIGFPIVNNRIEDDLERRVPEELAAAGFTGITASFSGQDGTLTCAEPLADPEGATAAAFDVWGVREVTLDRGCRVNAAGGQAGETGDATATASDGTATANSDGTDPSASTLAGEPFEGVIDALASVPDLTFLASLIEQSGMADELADATAGPFTIFAPTDAAFEALPVDTTARLQSDTELLRDVLSHHVVSGELLTADLDPDGVGTTVEGMDGRAIVLARTDGRVVVDGATILVPDLIAENGVVHVVDRVLLRPDLVTADAEPAQVAVTSGPGSLRLTGVVASEVDRATLVDAATDVVGDGTVVDELTVDPDTGLGGELAAQLAVLVVPMPSTLASGTAGFDGEQLYLSGVALSDEAAASIAAIAEAVGVDPELEVRADATAAEAALLEQQLNEFVAGNPVQFEPGSAVLTADAATVLDQLAALVAPVGGIAITVEGHTDSDGDPLANLALSRQRAAAVRDGLVARGVDAGSITADGFGAQRPVLVDGVEDKAASRRVEFVIVPAA